MQVLSRTQSLSLEFGGEESRCILDSNSAALCLKVPHLAGNSCFPLLEACEVERAGDFVLATTETRMAGIVAVPIHGALEDPAFQIYRNLLEIVGDRQLHRVWNFVPNINAASGNLENYRGFNIGRHRAFEERFGERCQSHMSPASAVGIDDSLLSIAFLCGSDRIENVENPEQTPAYRYPSEHGPKSPSFTRGGHGIIDGTPVGYLSGTSSIKDHRSLGSDLGSQFATTIDNMRIVIKSMGYEGALGNGHGMRREFNFYLRHADDLGEARELFRGAVGDSGIAATRFVRADICRSELNLEIEGLFSRP